MEKVLQDLGKDFVWDRLRLKTDDRGLPVSGIERGKHCVKSKCTKLSLMPGLKSQSTCEAEGANWSGGQCFSPNVTSKGQVVPTDQFYRDSIQILDQTTPGSGLRYDKEKPCPCGDAKCKSETCGGIYRDRETLGEWSAKLARLWDILRKYPDDKHFVFARDPRGVGIRAVAQMLGNMSDESGRRPYRKYTQCRKGSRPDLSADVEAARRGGFKYFIVYDQNEAHCCGGGAGESAAAKGSVTKPTCSRGRPPCRSEDWTWMCGKKDARESWKNAFNSPVFNLGSTRRVVAAGRGTLRGPRSEPNPAPTITVFLSNKNEGIDLKGVRWIHLLTPQTIPQEQQTIGRAIRFCSFLGIPKDEWKVRVVEYFNVNPEGMMTAKAESSAQKCKEAGQI